MIKPLLAVLAATLTMACGPDALATFPTSATPVVSQPVSNTNGPFPIPGTSIEPNSVVQDTIEASAPQCFPNWDASGRCRQYDLEMPLDGTMLVTLQWPGPSRGLYDPEVFVVMPNRSRVDYEGAWPERTLRMKAARGEQFRIVIIAYPPFPNEFLLTVHFSPD
jgi:hypothetical protein